VSRKKGLPDEKKMRHSKHFIDVLFERDDNPIGMSIPIEAIETNPEQPRKELGDMEGLIESIKQNGILEPLIVTPVGDGKFRIIAGERRYHAAVACGMTTIPCVEILIENESQALEIALIENLQRKDLDPFEEAEGYFTLQEKYGYTHEEIAKKIGKKRSTISETILLAKLPEEIKNLCRHADIKSKTLLIEVAKAKDLKEMREIIDSIVSGKAREEIRKLRKEKNYSERKGFLFEWKDKELPFQLKIKYNGNEEEKREKIIQILKTLIEKIEKKEIDI
jgi:ParB family chromosome partitioning protein